MQKTIFAALNIIKYEGDNLHQIIATGADGNSLWAFEVTREVANELAKKMDLQIIIVKKQKSWQEDVQIADAEEEKNVPQSNANTTLHVAASASEN